MPLDSRYILASDLLSAFFDKDTGEPLSNGVITFYQDQARTIPKNVFQISGTPPNYIYTDLGNEITLSATGLMQNPDTGQIIILLYFPFEGTPAPNDSDGTIELYYVTCYNEDGVEQWTREGWPNYTDTTSTEVDFTNFIPNGQFLFHNNVPLIDTTKTAGEITQPITEVAQGGWTFERPAGSSAKDIVLFDPFDAFVTNPSASPQYAIQISCETPNAGDDTKDLRIKFTDVNKFASATQKYSFAFTGQSNTLSSLTVNLILIKYFGTGGSATTETPIGNLTITSSYSVVQKSGGFVFGDNTSKTIGDGSYLQLALRFPLNSVFDASLTDFILTPEAITIASFPQTTDGQFSNQALIAPAPTPDGSDLYLPLQLTGLGLRYDSSEIGDVISESQISTYVSSLHPTTNRMLADGKQYERLAYSSLGIPHKRLFDKYWSTALQVPIYGTGAEYFTAYYAGSGNELVVANNTSGAVTATADGAIATGFTFAEVHAGLNYHTKSYLINATTFYIENLELGVVTASDAQTSTFTLATIQIGSTLLPQITSVVTTVAAGLAGLYFNFDSYTAGMPVLYYVWFKVDGAGADPAPAMRTGILVSLNSTDTAAIVAEKIRESLNGWQVSSIKTTAASAITTGSYFTINSTAEDYYVWYKKDGVGTDPAPASRTGIQVDIVTADTDALVATKTQKVMNEKYYAVPDLRGFILRGWNNASGNDPEAATRYSLVPGVIGDMLGTLQGSANKSHFHNETTPAALTIQLGPDLLNAGNLINRDTGLEGTYESRPKNKYVNYVIKY